MLSTFRKPPISPEEEKCRKYILGIDDCKLHGCNELNTIVLERERNFRCNASIKYTIQEQPKENVQILFNIHHENDHFGAYHEPNTVPCYTPKFAAFSVIKISLSIKFLNMVHEYYVGPDEQFYYQVDIKALTEIEENGKLHVSLPRSYFLGRKAATLEFTPQELVFPVGHSIDKINHICFTIKRIKGEKLRAKNNVCSDDIAGSAINQNITVTVGDTNFSVCKKALISKSAVFAAMFRHDMTESSSNTIKIKDFDASVIEDFINYINTGKTDDFIRNPIDLYTVADKYEVEDLQEACLQYLIFDLDFYNATELLMMADLFNMPKLKKFVKSFCKQHEKEMIQIKEFRFYIIQSLSIETIVEAFRLCEKYPLDDIRNAIYEYLQDNINLEKCLRNHLDELWENDVFHSFIAETFGSFVRGTIELERREKCYELQNSR